MKRNAIFLILGACAVLCMGQWAHFVQWTALSTPRVPWTRLGNTITVQSADIDVTQRDYSTLWGFADANTLTGTFSDDVTATEFRFSTTADADAQVIQIWVAANDATTEGAEDSFTLGATLTLTGGKQPGPYGNYFVDTIAVTAGVLTGGEVADSAADRMCVWRVDLRGWKKVVIVATQLAAKTEIYADVRWF